MDLEGGGGGVQRVALKFENGTFYLRFLGVFLQIYLGFFHNVMVRFSTEKFDPTQVMYMPRVETFPGQR